MYAILVMFANLFNLLIDTAKLKESKRAEAEAKVADSDPAGWFNQHFNGVQPSEDEATKAGTKEREAD